MEDTHVQEFIVSPEEVQKDPQLDNIVSWMIQSYLENHQKFYCQYSGTKKQHKVIIQTVQ